MWCCCANGICRKRQLKEPIVLRELVVVANPNNLDYCYRLARSYEALADVEWKSGRTNIAGSDPEGKRTTF